MKLPPPSPPPSDASKFEYAKDKTFTKRTVKGAAGGMLGADYEDERRPDPGAGKKSGAQRAEGNALHPADPRATGPGDTHQDAGKVGDPKDGSRLILEDDEAQTRPGTKKRRQLDYHRDRMSVDKDPPNTEKRRRWDQDPDDEASAEEREQDQVFELLRGDGVEGGAPGVSRAHLFAKDERLKPGDLSLTDPEEIQRALGSPAAYAKHVMILAEAFRHATGATRAEAVQYLAAMFVAPRDRNFGRVCVKEFGPSTGVVDIYPLEVTEHILEHYPGFLTKVGYGRLFRRTDANKELLRTDTETPLILEYPEHLKLRGFALRGGGRPGYTFEPAEEPGHYRLHIQTAGRYELLISGVNRSGYTVIERLEIAVRPAKGAIAALERVPDTAYPPRDPEKVGAWHFPKPGPIDPREILADSLDLPKKKKGALLSAAELAWRKAADAIGEGVIDAGPFLVVDSDPPTSPTTPAPPTPKESPMSDQDAALLAGAFESSAKVPAVKPTQPLGEDETYIEAAPDDQLREAVLTRDRPVRQAPPREDTDLESPPVQPVPANVDAPGDAALFQDTDAFAIPESLSDTRPPLKPTKTSGKKAPLPALTPIRARGEERGPKPPQQNSRRPARNAPSGAPIGAPRVLADRADAEQVTLAERAQDILSRSQEIAGSSLASQPLVAPPSPPTPVGEEENTGDDEADLDPRFQSDEETIRHERDD